MPQPRRSVWDEIDAALGAATGSVWDEIDREIGPDPFAPPPEAASVIATSPVERMRPATSVADLQMRPRAVQPGAVPLPPDPTQTPIERAMTTGRPMELLQDPRLAGIAPQAQAVAGLTQGVLGTVKGTAGAVEALSQLDPALGLLGLPAQAVSRAIDPVLEQLSDPRLEQGVLSNPKLLVDPQYLGRMAGQVGGSVVGMGGAGLAGRALMAKALGQNLSRLAQAAGTSLSIGVTESATEAGNAYYDALEAGRAPVEAADAAGRVLAGNLAMNAPMMLAERLVPGGPVAGKVARGAIESTQEGLQSALSQQATAGDVDLTTLPDEMLAGALAGPAFGATQDRADRPQARPPVRGIPVPLRPSAPSVSPALQARLQKQDVLAAIAASQQAREGSRFLHAPPPLPTVQPKVETPVDAQPDVPRETPTATEAQGVEPTLVIPPPAAPATDVAPLTSDIWAQIDAEIGTEPPQIPLSDEQRVAKGGVPPSTDLAYAAGTDAGNRSMRAAGRAAWNDEDRDAAAAVTNQIMDAAGVPSVESPAPPVRVSPSRPEPPGIGSRPSQIELEVSKSLADDYERERRDLEEQKLRIKAQHNPSRLRYGSQKWHAYQKALGAVEDKLSKLVTKSQGIKDEAHQNRLREAYYVDDTPWEVKWAIAAKLSRGSDVGRQAYDAIRDAATAELTARGATAEEAERYGVDVASMLTSYPLSDVHRFDKAIPAAMRRIENTRAEATDREKLLALEQQYKLQSSKFHIGQDTTPEERARVLADAEAYYKQRRAEIDADEAKAKAAADEHAARIASYTKPGRFSARVPNDEPAGSFSLKLTPDLTKLEVVSRFIDIARDGDFRLLPLRDQARVWDVLDAVDVNAIESKDLRKPDQRAKLAERIATILDKATERLDAGDTKPKTKKAKPPVPVKPIKARSTALGEFMDEDDAPAERPLQRFIDPDSPGGSPTRRPFSSGVPLSIAQALRPTAPMSEPETIRALTWIFAHETASESWAQKLLGASKAPLAVRARHFRARAMGVYKPWSEVIRLRNAFDLTTFAHELGHHIDLGLFKRAGMAPRRNFAKELLALGAATSRKSYSADLQMKEGVAEYFRLWFPNPDEARRQAPQFSAELDRVLEANEGLRAQLLAGQRVIQQYLSQDVGTRGRARINTTPTGVAKAKATVEGLLTTPQQRVELARRFIAKAFDEAHATRVAVADLAQHGGVGVSAAKNAYTLQRVAAGTAGKAEGFLKFGVRGPDGRWLSGSLEQAIAPLAHRLTPDQTKMRRPDLASYLVALRAIEVRGQGKNPGMKLAEAQRILEETEADPEFATFAQARDAIYAYQSALLDYAEQYGALGSEQVSAIRAAGEYYVPLQRVLTATAGRGGTSSAVANRTSPVKRLKGSGYDIIDPFESIITNTAAIVDMVEHNKAMAALVDQADKVAELRNAGRDDVRGAGVWLDEIPADLLPTSFKLEQVQKAVREELEAAGIDLPEGIDWQRLVTVFTPTTVGDPKDRIVTAIVKGRRRFFQVQDEGLYQAISALGPRTAEGLVPWMAGQATSVLRAGATLRPSFILRNLWRDTVGAMLQSRHGFIPLYDSLTGLASMTRQDEDFKLFMTSGVQQAALLGGDRNRVKSVLETLGRSRKEKAIHLARNPLDALRLLSEQIEVATRLGEFKLALGSGGQERRGGVLGIAQRLTGQVGKPGEWWRTSPGRSTSEDALTTATLAARDVTTDFSRGGSASKELSRYKAFFNARTQGYLRIGESIHRDPVGVGLTVAMMSALSAALWWWNKDDEDYQEIPQQERLDYWHVKLPGSDFFVRIPKPHEWGLVPNLMEATLDAAWAKDPDAVRRFRDAFLPARLGDFVVGITPTILLPALEAITNYDTYRKRNIVSPYDEALAPELQAKDWTGDTARAIGALTGTSPAKVEHVLFGYTGGLGRDMASVTDLVAQRVTGREAAPRPSTPWQRAVPGAGAMFREGSSGSRAQSIQDFYAASKRLDSLKASIRRFESQGLTHRAAQEQATLDREFPEARVEALRDAKEQFEAIGDDLDALYADRALSRQEKRQQIDALYRSMTRVAAHALGRPWAAGKGAPPVPVAAR